MIEELELLDAKLVATLGIDVIASNEVSEGCRAAGANYVTVDRADAQFAVMELCLEMRSPRKSRGSDSSK